MASRVLITLLILFAITACSNKDSDCDEASAAWAEASREVDRSCNEMADCVYGRWDACGCPTASNVGNDFDAIVQLRNDVESTCGDVLCANNVVCPETLDTVAPAHPPLCVNNRCVAPQPAYVDSATIEPAQVTVAEVEAGTGVFTVTATLIGDYGEVDVSASSVSIPRRDVVGTPTSVSETTPGTVVLEIPYSWLDGLGPRTYSVDIEIVTQYESFFSGDIAEIEVTP